MRLEEYVDGLVEGKRGKLRQRKRERWVWRVEEKGQVWFAKRGVGKKRREVRREAENARALETAGLGAEVLACGEHDGAEWLVTRDAGRSFLWDLWVVQAEPYRAKRLRELAGLVHSLHDRGWTFPDLTEQHVRAGPQPPVLIDAARLARGRSAAPVSRRAEDLAALLFSMGPTWTGHRRLNLSRIERVRLLREATGLDGAALRHLCKRVDARMTALSLRTRWRHGLWESSDEVMDAIKEHPGAGDIEHFDRLLLREATRVVRTLPDRENRTLGRDTHGRPLFFLKIYPPTKSADWSPAMREVAAIDLFQRAGILVNRLAAYAEDVDKGSMVAVAAARGEPLDDLLRRGVSVAERRALAVQTGRIWRRMRECGLRHRDAYPCHLFAAPWGNEPLRFELRLIDMTRAGKAPFPKERWFVKDAAALWHGLPKPPVTRTDAVRWLREYFRIERLDARAKRFARRVAAKERRIAARQARKARR